MFVWGPFKILKEQLEFTSPAITVEDIRLLLEDLMLLEKGEEVFVLMSSDHQLFKKKGGGHAAFMTSFLEDLMLLEQGEEVLVLMSSDHQLFKKKGGHAAFMTSFLQSVAIDPKRPETFK